MSKILNAADNEAQEKEQQAQEIKKVMKQQVKFFDFSGLDHGYEKEINDWIQENNVVVESIQITSHSAGQWNSSQYGIVVLYHTFEE